MINEDNPKLGFASDNNSGIHPQVMEAIIKANIGHVPAYGEDTFSKSAKELFRKHFGQNVETFFVTTGTAANVLGLLASTQSYNSIICARSSHLHADECSAPQKITGCTLIQVDTQDGKLNVPLIEPFICRFGDTHHPQPRIISIAEPTEFETVYSLGELGALAKFAHSKGMLLHMDGARLSNAAVSLGVELKSVTADVGVDILSFGGTKNGAMLAESLVFFNPKLAVNFEYFQKQCLQLVSKMRFIAVQFEALLSNNLWQSNAIHANKIATLLSGRIEEEIGLAAQYPVQANSVFVRFTKKQAIRLLEKYFVYEWDDNGLIRFMTSFDTSEEDIDKLLKDLKDICLV